MISVFLDLETLDTRPSAIVTEGAFVAFDEETGEILGELEISPDFWDQLSAGRTWSKETVAFHGRLGTLPEGRGDDVRECELFVTEFFRSHAPERVWIRHLGWMARADREAKVARYTDASAHLAPAELAHLHSVLDEPHSSVYA
jgi:hypothetical protein